MRLLVIAGLALLCAGLAKPSALTAQCQDCYWEAATTGFVHYCPVAGLPTFRKFEGCDHNTWIQVDCSIHPICNVYAAASEAVLNLLVPEEEEVNFVRLAELALTHPRAVRFVPATMAIQVYDCKGKLLGERRFSGVGAENFRRFLVNSAG